MIALSPIPVKDGRNYFTNRLICAIYFFLSILYDGFGKSI